MSYEDETTGLQRNNRGTAPVGSLPQHKSKGLCQNTPCQITLAAFLAILLILTVACCVLLSVFHSHLLFLCAYAEFMVMIILQGIVVIFVAYHTYNIYKYFAPSKEDDDDYDKMDGDDADEEYEEDNDFENSKLMKVIFFIVKVTAALISLAAAVILIAFTVSSITYQQLSLPQLSGQLKLAGITTTAKVIRENSGVVHIQADNDHDMFFAQGVVLAQERMWQMELLRRIATGTLAEITGKDALNVDKFSKTMGFRRVAERTLPNLTQETVDAITAYVDGINAYISLGQHLAPEFHLLQTKPQKWEVIDIVAFSKLFSWDLALNADMEAVRYKLLQAGISVERINQIYPGYPADGPTVLNDEEMNITATEEEKQALEKKFNDDSGSYKPQPKNLGSLISDAQKTVLKYLPAGFNKAASNNWVISKDLSKAGMPILANDPHLGLSAPGVWYLIHLQSKSGFNSIGACLPGAPGVIIGQNDKISWGVTNGAVDIQDLFVMEEVDENTYVYKNERIPYNTTTYTLKVKGEKDETFTVKESVLGPVVNWYYGIDPTPSITLYSRTLKDDDRTLETFLRTPKAQNWEEFVDALRYFDAPSQNFVYADREGNIGYYLPGRIPIRKQGHSGKFPVLGNGDWEYEGFIPFEELPHVFNPTKGYIASANNRIAPRGYKYSLAIDFENQYRAKRIVQLIEEKKVHNNMTVDDIIAIQMDTHSLLFDEFKFIFPKIKANVSEDAQVWIDKFEKWDGNMKEGSEEAAVFEAWLSEFANVTYFEIKETLLKRYISFLVTAAKNDDEVACQNWNMTCTEYAAYSFNAAVKTIEETFGGTAPLWGTDVHEIVFDNALLKDQALKCIASKSVFSIGGSETVNVADTTYPDLQTREGPSYRQIIDLSTPVNGTAQNDKFIIPLGQSGNWLSKSYDSYSSMWKSGQYLSMKFNNYDVASTLEITP